MKKTMLIMPVLLAFSLTGCSLLKNIFNRGSNNSNSQQASSDSGSQQSSTSQSGGGTIKITLNDMNIVTTSVYPTNDTNFSVGGVDFIANNGVGKTKDSYNPGYASLKCFQFNKADDESKDPVRKRGAITNPNSLPLTQIQMTWYSTYGERSSEYFPVVRAGSSAGSLSAVTCNQTSPITGASTGVKDGSYDVYSYVTTYTIASGNTFFSIEGASGYASYVSEVLLTR